MKILKLLLTSLLLFTLASCGSSAINTAKLKASDAVGKYSKEFFETQALKELGDSEFQTLGCAEEASVLSLKMRDATDGLLKAERSQENALQKSLGSDLAGLGCNFLLKQVIGTAVGGKFDDYKCAQKLFGRGLEKGADLLCPFIQSKLE